MSQTSTQHVVSTDADTVTLPVEDFNALVHRVNSLEENQDDIRQQVDENTADIDTVEERVSDLELRFDAFGNWLDNLEDTIGGLSDTLSSVVNDAINPGDYIDAGADDRLPIQRENKARKDGTIDTTKNRERATLIWDVFHEDAIREGGKMKFTSPMVKRLMDKHDLPNNNNTKRRMMQFCASMTSTKPKDERTPDDEANLISLKQPRDKMVLVADCDDWDTFFEEQTQAVTVGDDNRNGGVTAGVTECNDNRNGGVTEGVTECNDNRNGGVTEDDSSENAIAEDATDELDALLNATTEDEKETETTETVTVS